METFADKLNVLRIPYYLKNIKESPMIKQVANILNTYFSKLVPRISLLRRAP